MRSASPAGQPDLTARARIRQAAVDCIVDEGFSTSVRAIARRAGVSGGLIEYHYGSKASLFDACDDYVLTLLADIKLARIHSEAPAQGMMTTLASTEHAWIAGYLVRAIQAGGERARLAYERLVTDTMEQFEESERRGIVSSSRDPEARARWVTASGIGAFVVQAHLHPEASPAELFRRFADEFALPMLESYTEPVFIDRSFLDLYLEAVQHLRTAATPTQENP